MPSSRRTRKGENGDFRPRYQDVVRPEVPDTGERGEIGRIASAVAIIRYSPRGSSRRRAVTAGGSPGISAVRTLGR